MFILFKADVSLVSPGSQFGILKFHTFHVKQVDCLIWSTTWSKLLVGLHDFTVPTKKSRIHGNKITCQSGQQNQLNVWPRPSPCFNLIFASQAHGPHGHQTNCTVFLVDNDFNKKPHTMWFLRIPSWLINSYNYVYNSYNPHEYYSYVRHNPNR